MAKPDRRRGGPPPAGGGRREPSRERRRHRQHHQEPEGPRTRRGRDGRGSEAGRLRDRRGPHPRNGAHARVCRGVRRRRHDGNGHLHGDDAGHIRCGETRRHETGDVLRDGRQPVRGVRQARRRHGDRGALPLLHLRGHDADRHLQKGLTGQREDTLLRTFEQSGGVLEIGGVPVTEIAAEYGTPLYIYDAGLVRDRYMALREAMPAFEVFFSMKANPSLSLIGFLRTLGAGAEIASGGELFLAGEAGYDPLDIVFAGPGKTDRELEESVLAGVYAINVETLRELSRLGRIAKLLSLPARAALRVNTSKGLSRSGDGSAGPLHEQMAGGPSKFGIDEEKLEALDDAWDRSAVEIVGVHVYTASQILHEDEILANAKRTLEATVRVEEAVGAPVTSIDFGGGFGVPHYEDEEELDLETLGRGLEEVFAPFLEREDARLILELGRYLTSDAGVYLTRVVELKESRGERYVITDGGINQFVRPVLMRVDHEAAVVNKLDRAPSLTAHITGPLCTPIDVTAREVDVPESIAIDDLVGIMNAGSYGFSMSPQLFLSHPTPAEVLVLDGELIEARSRGTYEDLLIKQKRFPGTV
ncbi:MAG: diaminopimelate decarboxylase [Candidatus Eisenbacteria bacterium]|nr:diaminopimelate decarboxylase [Candidatus Eisenbacteria bacterium]